MNNQSDLLVVGGGIAGLSAAIEAAEAGLSVTILEAAPAAERGGNTAFAGGAIRCAYNGVEDLQRAIPWMSAEDFDEYEVTPYTEGDFLDDMARTTEYQCDPELAGQLVELSRPTVYWLGERGVRFEPRVAIANRSAAGKMTFPGGVAMYVTGGGKGAVEGLHKTAAARGVEVIYEARAQSAARDAHGYLVTYRGADGQGHDIRGKQLVLATGGFSASPQLRAQYLGANWDLVKVKGSQSSVGDGIALGTQLGAATAGHWSGCHAVAWESNAPDVVSHQLAGTFHRNGFMYGIMVNRRGERFLDEGADHRHYFYATIGRQIMAQPDRIAWQVFDSTANELLEDSYRDRRSTRVVADTIEELGRKMQDVDVETFARTVEEYNAAIPSDAPPFKPWDTDGRSTRGLAVDKSNWAVELSTPPFSAYQVTPGITFTFGGLKVDSSSRVLTQSGAGTSVIPGLYAAGELIGGLFAFNYPGGAALPAAAVFGRLAGQSAAARHLDPTRN